MRKPLLKRLSFLATVLYLFFSLFSCNTTKRIKYFQDIPDSGQTKTIAKAEYTDPIIRSGDILNVIIETIDPLATSSVNTGNISAGNMSNGGAASGILAAISGGNQTQQPVSGFLVDKNGVIEIPIIGKVTVAGLTTDQIKNSIYTLSLKYFKDPTIVVRLANFKVSVTGEVLKPGQYIMPDEKETILDAITMAGDLTIFGKRENVLLIRENADGSKTPYRINLKKSNIMSEPYYYLRQNDLIYVEPRKAKSDATDAAQAKYITIAGSILSILLVIATRRL